MDPTTAAQMIINRTLAGPHAGRYVCMYVCMYVRAVGAGNIRDQDTYYICTHIHHTYIYNNIASVEDDPYPA
jgi:hypothetical protein